MPYPLFPAIPTPAMAARSNEKEKGVNVQVLLRCRPFSEEEARVRPSQVIACNEARREVSVSLNVAGKQVDRTFAFDKVFGPHAQQKDLYDQAVVPIVNEVLEGFNCTIFAYGQTGTGKTYTMEGGGKKSKNGELPAEAGVIPRAVQQIFDTLDSQNSEYSMKVTFIELYNEEITDLLAPDDITRSLEDRQKRPLALMEDGKGGVLVRGLEEEIVYSANEIYNLLERGSAKRRTAETLLNKQSSRSHSIFSITIHIKEATPEGEELIKCGKLNLVDLAGSENISRSGAREGRAREAGEINKSLLTLGRVITALVEHLGHIPYRDSKLTRLLRDSLGGRTKTCIIATVSPSVHCLEETLSTLDYAHRAKNIKNKPEVNQKMMKSALIKDLYVEIERLKTEVLAAREKNGIYLPRERYYQEEAEKKAMVERIEQLECESDVKDKQLDELQEMLKSQQQLCGDLTLKLEMTQKRLEQTQDALLEAKERINQAQYTIREKDHIVANLQQSENRLVEQATSLQIELERSVNDITELHQKIERKDTVETQNQKLVQTFHGAFAEHLKSLHIIVTESVEKQQQQLQNLSQQVQSFLTSKDEAMEGLRKKMLSLKDVFSFGLKSINDLIHSHEKDSSFTFKKLNSSVVTHATSLEQLLLKATSEAELVLTDFQTVLHDQESEIVSFTQQQHELAEESIAATRAVSRTTIDFFETLQTSTTELLASIEEGQKVQTNSLMEFQGTYEECSKEEEKLLVTKIAEMLAASTTRKLQLVHASINTIKESAARESGNLQKGMLRMQSVASDVQTEWHAFAMNAEDDYHKGLVALQKKQCRMQDLLGCSIKSSQTAKENWENAQESLQQLEKNNILVVDSISKEGIYGNGLLLTNMSKLGQSIESNIYSGNETVLESINCAFQLDRDVSETLLSNASSQSLALEDLQSFHQTGTKEIILKADQCFEEEYLEDKPTCATPRRRSIEVPDKTSIEDLRAPCFEELIQEFREANNNNSSLLCDKSPYQKNAMARETKIPIFADSSLLRDSRVPLTTVN